MPEEEEPKATSDNQIRFRADAALLKQLTTRRAGHGASTGLIAKRDLERYYHLIGRFIPYFEDEEAGMIIEALIGEDIDYRYAHLLWAVVDEAIKIRKLEQRWTVDRETLVGKLRALSHIEKLAVIDAAERAAVIFNKLYDLEGPFEQNEAMLRAAAIVDLCIGDVLF